MFPLHHVPTTSCSHSTMFPLHHLCIPNHILLLPTIPTTFARRKYVICLQYGNIVPCHSIAPWNLTSPLLSMKQHSSTAVINQITCLSLCDSQTLFTLRTGLWARIARKVCWLACCKISDVVGHPGIFGTLHLAYYVWGHTTSYFGIQVVCHLGCRAHSHCCRFTQI